ncbi:unnamed protein product [Acanthoscelides obtectus]|uniref:Uncharacterized protein n=1 Tax=Acanthoscelides obtectus TaxID=200917 RepID=A0A9P0K518_ACAOB|nr:unnamed protein product [Acanthoscelides obtectus]CAK1626760.1 hypothetical protein AOBTE_LOCUS4060 [Acanthoscelides obtectus]
MPVICTSSRKPSYQPITYRILQRKQEENKHDPDTLKTFSVRASETSSLSSASKSLVGTAVPNSTAKERLSRRAVFQPRRPTIETIRLAIEQAKKETNKKMGTEDVSAGISLNDAATSTDKKKKMITKKKKPGSANQSTGSSRSTSATRSTTITKEKKVAKKKVENDTFPLRIKIKSTVTK